MICAIVFNRILSFKFQILQHDLFDFHIASPLHCCFITSFQKVTFINIGLTSCSSVEAAISSIYVMLTTWKLYHIFANAYFSLSLKFLIKRWFLAKRKKYTALVCFYQRSQYPSIVLVKCRFYCVAVLFMISIT